MSSVLASEQWQGFVADYNRSSFAFDHGFHETGLFDLAELAAMAARLPDPAYYSSADSAVSDGWKRVGDRRTSLSTTLRTIAETSSLVLLKHCEKDPEHGAIFRRLMTDVVESVGAELRDDLDEGRATIVISSPGRITSYHIDAEVNFLLQVRGHKLLHAFDPSDRTILTENELEAFYSGDWDSARYKSEREDSARVYALAPGKGVHLPLHAPHWAQNLDDVSVGVSLNFNLRSGTRLARLYRVNHRLRTLGLRPAAPGSSQVQDWLKIAAFAGAKYVRPLLRARSTRAPSN